MGTRGKTIGISVAAVLLLAGLTTQAQGQCPHGSGGYGEASRGWLEFIGTVICIDCTVEEIREAQPELGHLYQLNHERGQIVLTITEVNHQKYGWGTLAYPPKFYVCAKGNVFEQLATEEALFKKVEISAMLRSTRRLDIFTIVFLGEEREDATSASEVRWG
jgi:hypothetical protein